ncbi:MAG TPA: beta-N-acetylhexosaminidase [Gammaproteobacteria bacterium]|nr:beta-N-acetylhexosaminidase [Gammaproteobacteria bacterium]
MPGPLMVSIEGLSLDASTRTRLSQAEIGGVILFSRNFVSPGQLADLTSEIRALRSPALLIAVDQEGGRVQRFQEGFTSLPAMGVIGERYDADPNEALTLARATGIVLASELRRSGIDFSFAPVVDVGSTNRAIGTRAFHRDPNVVQQLALRVAEGMTYCGMRSVAKHFPGHSGVLEDPHHELPRDERTLDMLRQHDLRIYENLDLEFITGIMSCHVCFPKIDSVPASLSHRLLTGELRTRIGFKGPVFSDDLMMGALRTFGDPGALTTMAIEAGCDMVLLCNSDSATDAVLGARSLPPLSESARARLEKMRPEQTGLPSSETLEQARRLVRNYA